MPIAPRAPPTAMQGKCERGHSFSTPGLQFHGVDRADVYYNICVRASRCGKCALNPLTSHPIPRRRPTPVPAQRHARPEHARSPTQRRYTPADCAIHSPPTTQLIPRRRPSPAPAQRHARPEHFRSPTQRRRTPSGCAIHAPPTVPPIPRRRPSPASTQRHALPEHFRSPTQPRSTPADLTTRSRPTSFARPHAATRPPRALPLPHAAPMHSSPTSQHLPRRRSSPAHAQRHAPLPFRFGHKKTAPHSACAMPNVSVDRRCGRSFGLVSRALFAAVAGRWRVGVGLRPQPWALRSRRCGRVLRA